MGHGDDVGLLSLRGDLPPVEDFLWRTVEYHSGRVPVPPGVDATFVEPLHGVFGGLQHSEDSLSPVLLAVAVDGVPDHEGGEAVAGTRQGGVVDADEFHGPAQGFHQVSAGEDDAAGQGRTDELVAADGDAVYASVEPEGLRVFHVGQDHAAEGRVGVDVMFPDSQFVEDGTDRG